MQVGLQSVTLFLVLIPRVVRHIRVADNIVVMGAEGTVIEQGTFNQLNLQDGYVQGLLLKQQERKMSVDAPELSPETLHSRLPAGAAVVLDQQRELSRQMGDSRLYLYYLKSIGWQLGVSQLVISVCYTFLEFFPRKRILKMILILAHTMLTAMMQRYG
jgi:ATP-binding cassette subfamily C (CFTR/MRP) protein 1